MSIKIPNYITNTDVRITINITESVTVPAGTWVKPVEYYYVPKHIKDIPWWKHLNTEERVFTYSHYGFLPIPRKHISEK